MPRLPPSAIRSASRLNKYVPRLLQESGDLRSAQNELRWMKESLLDTHFRNGDQERKHCHFRFRSRSTSLGKKLERYVARRTRGEPLQYILGSQPFGELEIKCRPQVLIPRGETETYTTQVAKTVTCLPYVTADGLRIADFCTGSGCIALLLYSLLGPKLGEKLRIHGFDISQHALSLARENLHHNVSKQVLHSDANSGISFDYADVLALGSMPMNGIGAALPTPNLDVVISNPPYISPQHFSVGGPTSRSVRKYEPKLALVPPEVTVFSGAEQADQFYVALLRIAIATRAKLLVMEVGDTAQALRVANICMRKERHVDHDFETPRNTYVEMWKDDGGLVSADAADRVLRQAGSKSHSEQYQEAECRAVVVWLDQGWTSHRLKCSS